MDDREILLYDAEHYRRLLTQGKLSLAARETVHKLLAKVEAEIEALKSRPRMQ